MVVVGRYTLPSGAYHDRHGKRERGIAPARDVYQYFTANRLAARIAPAPSEIMLRESGRVSLPAPFVLAKRALGGPREYALKVMHLDRVSF